MLANPNLNVVIASPTVFRAEDRTDPRFFLFATLLAGVLRFEVVAKLATGDRGSVSGKAFFDAMMTHFGGKAKTIEGNWSLGSGLTSNLDILNRATAAGLTVDEAAPLTWTGLRASEYGYDKVIVVHALPQGAQGFYEDVRVYFSH